LLPNGAVAKQVGERVNDRMLLWADDETGALDERGVHERCGSGWQIRKIGKNLFVATRTESAAAPAEPESVLEEVSLLDQAKALLATARQAGDCHKQGLPLVDLGIICVQNGKIPQAIELLQRAVAIAQVRGSSARKRRPDQLGHGAARTWYAYPSRRFLFFHVFPSQHRLPST